MASEPGKHPSADPTAWIRPFGRGIALGVSPVAVLFVGSLFSPGVGVRVLLTSVSRVLLVLAVIGAAWALTAPRRRGSFGLGVGTGLLMGLGLWFIAAMFSLVGGDVVLGG